MENKHCEICSIEFTHKDRVVQIKNSIIKIYKSLYNTQSKINSARCITCENIEEKIANECGICKCGFDNNLRLYCLHGNTCKDCIIIINEKIRYDSDLRKVSFLDKKEDRTVKQDVELDKCIHFIKFYESKYAKNNRSQI